MGILLEADYKGVVSGRESPIAGLKRAFSSTKQGTQDPLSVKEGETLRPMESDGQLTYEVMNRDTGTSYSRAYVEWIGKWLNEWQRYLLHKKHRIEKSQHSSIFLLQQELRFYPHDTSRPNVKPRASSARRSRICGLYSYARRSCTIRHGHLHSRLQLQEESQA